MRRFLSDIATRVKKRLRRRYWSLAEPREYEWRVTREFAAGYFEWTYMAHFVDLNSGALSWRPEIPFGYPGPCTHISREKPQFFI